MKKLTIEELREMIREAVEFAGDLAPAPSRPKSHKPDTKPKVKAEPKVKSKKKGFDAEKAKKVEPKNVTDPKSKKSQAKERPAKEEKPLDIKDIKRGAVYSYYMPGFQKDTSIKVTDINVESDSITGIVSGDKETIDTNVRRLGSMISEPKVIEPKKSFKPVTTKKPEEKSYRNKLYKKTRGLSSFMYREELQKLINNEIQKTMLLEGFFSRMLNLIHSLHDAVSGELEKQEYNVPMHKLKRTAPYFYDKFYAEFDGDEQKIKEAFKKLADEYQRVHGKSKK